MGKVYRFDEQFALGQVAEEFIKHELETRFKVAVSEAPRSLQSLGIDFILQQNNKRYSAELKTDFRAHQTGNAFVETISVQDPETDEVKAYGWYYTSVAQVLLYYVPGINILFLVDMYKFKTLSLDNYITKVIRNKTYVGRGKVIPLAELAQYAVQLRVSPFACQGVDKSTTSE